MNKIHVTDSTAQNFQSVAIDDNYWSSLFASEALVLENSSAFQQYCEIEVLKKRGLILSKIAFDLYLPLAKKDAPRKDGFTPRTHHEQSHILTAEKIIQECGDKWINKDRWGSIDAFFTAIILHDAMEDLGLSLKDIRKHLSTELHKLHNKGDITDNQFRQAQKDIPQIVTMIKQLSRKNEKGVQFENGDRIKQAKRLLEHPYCSLIKQIDWSDKLQTIVGVDAFEKDEQAKLSKTLDETALIYVKEQQGLTEKAIEKYPQMKRPCQIMEGILSCQFQILRTYKQVKSEKISFDPKEADPLRLRRPLEKSLSFIRSLPKGLDKISPIITRLEKIGETNPRIKDYVDYMVKPGLPDLNPVKVGPIRAGFNFFIAQTRQQLNFATTPFLTRKL